MENNLEIARKIFGYDFITPAEINEACKLEYNEYKLRYFTEAIPAEETLRKLRTNNFIVIAGPPEPKKLSDIYALNPKMFSALKQEDLNIKDLAMPELMLIRKLPLKDSNGRSWNEQQRLVAKGERIPNAAEMVWALFIMNTVRHFKIFEMLDARTSSILKGEHVCVGHNRTDTGIRIYTQPNDLKSPEIALTVIYKI